MCRDNAMLEKAIKIFGNIVVDAFACIEDYGYDKSYIREKIQPYEASRDSSNIDIGGSTIRLVFNNGKEGEINSSEWGFISCPRMALSPPITGISQISR